MSENKTYKTNNEKLEDLSPFLASLKKENPFQAPENFFEELPEKINNRIQLEKSNENRGIRKLFGRPIYYLATAAASILILVAIWIFTNEKQPVTDLFSEISFEILMDESPELIEYMDEDDLIDALFVYSSETIEFSDIKLDSDTSLTEDDIFDYLDDENISNELLYNL